jgi:hypothetical protein
VRVGFQELGTELVISFPPGWLWPLDYQRFEASLGPQNGVGPEPFRAETGSMRIAPGGSSAPRVPTGSALTFGRR